VLPVTTGQGAGDTKAITTGQQKANLCNPFDPQCYASSLGQYIGTVIFDAFSPIEEFFQNSSANIVTQTPASDSYDNDMVKTLNADFVDVVDAALACLLLIGGFNAMVGPHLRMRQSSVTEVIPRAILVTFAVHFNLTFIGLFITFANDLSATVVGITQIQTLANIITGFLSLNILTGLLVIILVIVFLSMTVALLFQMTTRIALVALLCALAPLALACFVLPQTTRWGRLWMTTFSSAVLVQFFQVTALGLGGMFITSVGSSGLFSVGREIGSVFLAIGTVGLVLKIPGMLQTWALHPMMEASDSQSGQSSSSQSNSSENSSQSSESAGSSSSGSGASSSENFGTSFGGDMTTYVGDTNTFGGDTSSVANGFGGGSMGSDVSSTGSGNDAGSGFSGSNDMGGAAGGSSDALAGSAGATGAGAEGAAGGAASSEALSTAALVAL
jgi:hypothetical protein